jgi:hypothetical protein
MMCRCRIQSGDFADFVTAVQDASEALEFGIMVGSPSENRAASRRQEARQLRSLLGIARLDAAEGACASLRDAAQRVRPTVG